MLSGLISSSKVFASRAICKNLFKSSSISLFSTGPYDNFGSHYFDSAKMRSYFGENLYNKFVSASKGEKQLSENEQDQVYKGYS